VTSGLPILKRIDKYQRTARCLRSHGFVGRLPILVFVYASLGQLSSFPSRSSSWPISRPVYGQLNGVSMCEKKLENVDGEHVCSWCFARDETVLRDAETDTYWHQDCRDVAGDTIHHMQDWSPFRKKR